MFYLIAGVLTFLLLDQRLYLLNYFREKVDTKNYVQIEESRRKHMLFYALFFMVLVFAFT